MSRPNFLQQKAKMETDALRLVPTAERVTELSILTPGEGTDEHPAEAGSLRQSNELYENRRIIGLGCPSGMQ